MAEDANDDQEAAAKKKRANLLLTIGVVLVAIGASIAGTVYFLQNQAPPTADETVNTQEVVPHRQAIYHKMRPPFIIDYMSGDRTRFLQAEVTIMAREDVVVLAVVEHSPLIRNRIISYLSGQDFNEMQTPEGRHVLGEAVRELINTVLLEEIGRDGIETVLFTDFVMQ